MQENLVVRVPAQRSGLKLQPPAGIWGTAGVGAGLPARVRSQTGRQGQLAGWSEIPGTRPQSLNLPSVGLEQSSGLGRDTGSSPEGPSGTCCVALNDPTPAPGLEPGDRIDAFRELLGLYF